MDSETNVFDICVPAGFTQGRVQITINRPCNPDAYTNFKWQEARALNACRFPGIGVPGNWVSFRKFVSGNPDEAVSIFLKLL
jgi:hypothetical protein